MDICKHTTTQGRDGETGSWCIQCGEKILEVEPRACDDCIHFTRPASPIAGAVLTPPYCKKKMMTIISGLHVTYRVSEGTCFEGNPVHELLKQHEADTRQMGLMLVKQVRFASIINQLANIILDTKATSDNDRWEAEQAIELVRSLL